MSRSSYDDMPENRLNNRYSGNRGKTGLIAIACVLIAILFVLLFLIFTPSEKKDEVIAEAETPAPAEDLFIPEIFIPEPVSEEPVPEERAEAAEVAEEAVEEEIIEDGRIHWTEHKWADGDTLNSVADRYGISPDTVIAVNRIANIAAIKNGTMLRIPSMDGMVYTLSPSDTLSSLAERFNPSMSAEELGAVNGVDSVSLHDCSEIFIPAPEWEVFESPVPDFISPVNGSVSVYYGEFYNGRRIDGIVFSSYPGDAVRAALPGFIADAGLDPVYGKYAAIMHDDGYKTYYYALECIDVKIGETVEKGSVIGSAGTSSLYFGQPSLLFVVEQSGIRINPLNVLK